jgi:DNA invertase Pin-like site-specific DNA recombinase
MSVRHFLNYTPVVAYASLDHSNLNKDLDLDLLRKWSLRTPFKLDVVAEEVDPTSEHRPLWSEILEEIERGGIHTLVVPSLFHVAGYDLIALSKTLTFLKMHHVTLKSLSEVIDSRRSPRHDIIVALRDSISQMSQEIAHG